ncbi:glutamic acid-rich protein-like [Salvia splendens]|uniref:glutamic acid-rich protein-like n=1 Tax=Salvia splendens TaxID=180675 RepID=UPI001C27499C|nr:glutamic acid-rich protein-like [Salvia splendens]
MGAACQEEEATSTLTPLEIPPRPQTLIETPTSQALCTLRNPRPYRTPHIETPAQEITPTVPTSHIETQDPTEPRVEETKNTKEGEDKIEDEEGVKLTEEGDEGDWGDETGDEKEVKLTEEDDEDDEGGEAGDDEEVKSEGEGVGKQTEGDEKDNEIQEQVESMDDKGIPVDEITVRRHSRRAKNWENAAPAKLQRELRLSDSEETGDNIPQAQETPDAAEDVSPEALEKRYEAERKRKGKQEAKPHKKKPHQDCVGR